MDKVKIELEVPKEINEVRVAVVELLKDLIAGKDAGQILAENLKTLSDAVTDVDKLPVEVKEDLVGSLQVAGLFGAGVVAALLKK